MCSVKIAKYFKNERSFKTEGEGALRLKELRRALSHCQNQLLFERIQTASWMERCLGLVAES